VQDILTGYLTLKTYWVDM